MNKVDDVQNAATRLKPRNGVTHVTPRALSSSELVCWLPPEAFLPHRGRPDQIRYIYSRGECGTSHQSSCFAPCMERGRSAARRGGVPHENKNRLPGQSQNCRARSIAAKSFVAGRQRVAISTKRRALLDDAETLLHAASCSLSTEQYQFRVLRQCCVGGEHTRCQRKRLRNQKPVERIAMVHGKLRHHRGKNRIDR